MSEKKRKLAGSALLAMGILMTAAGIWRTEPAVVLRKAVAICMECIGIG